MGKELLMGKRLPGDYWNLSCSDGSPEVAVLLASYKLGIVEEVEGIVAN